jgi:hypothetical protein
MIVICAVLGGGAFLFIKNSEKKKKQILQADEEQKTANEFVNVKDIKGKFLYTRDGLILCYLKINPISIDLSSSLLPICRAYNILLNSLLSQGR